MRAAFGKNSPQLTSVIGSGTTELRLLTADDVAPYLQKIIDGLTPPIGNGVDQQRLDDANALKTQWAVIYAASEQSTADKRFSEEERRTAKTELADVMFETLLEVSMPNRDARKCWRIPSPQAWRGGQPLGQRESWLRVVSVLAAMKRWEDYHWLHSYRASAPYLCVSPAPLIPNEILLIQSKKASELGKHRRTNLPYQIESGLTRCNSTKTSPRISGVLTGCVAGLILLLVRKISFRNSVPPLNKHPLHKYSPLYDQVFFHHGIILFDSPLPDWPNFTGSQTIRFTKTL